MAAGTEATGKLPDDCEPASLPRSFLYGLFGEGKTRNHIVYIGEGEKSEKIRVNLKFKPKCTSLTYPAALANYKKTTLATMQAEDGEWELLEDRVSMDSKLDVANAGYEKMAIFVQPERIARLAGSESPGDCCAFYADMLITHSATMNEKQKQSYNQGVKQIRFEDEITKLMLKPGKEENYSQDGPSDWAKEDKHHG